MYKEDLPQSEIQDLLLRGLSVEEFMQNSSRFYLESVANYYGIGFDHAFALRKLRDHINQSWIPWRADTILYLPINCGIFALGLAAHSRSGFDLVETCVIRPIMYWEAQNLDAAIRSLLSSEGSTSVPCYVSCAPVEDAKLRSILLTALRGKLPSEVIGDPVLGPDFTWIVPKVSEARKTHTKLLGTLEFNIHKH